MSNNDIAVVRPHYAIENAYQNGFDRFEGADEVADSKGFEFAHFTETAKWANVIAPRLRAAAGAADPTGKGTYTAHRKVAAIKPGCEEDTPAEARLTDSKHIYEDLFGAYRNGAYDAMMSDREYGDTLEL